MSCGEKLFMLHSATIWNLLPHLVAIPVGGPPRPSLGSAGSLFFLFRFSGRVFPSLFGLRFFRGFAVPGGPHGSPLFVPKKRGGGAARPPFGAGSTFLRCHACACCLFLLPLTILRGLPPAWATKRCSACVGVIMVFGASYFPARTVTVQKNFLCNNVAMFGLETRSRVFPNPNGFNPRSCAAPCRPST